MMKRALITTALLAIFSTVVFAEQSIEEELLPEVKALFEVKPLDPNRLKDNFYIQAQGLLFPKENWQTIYGEILIKNDPIIMSDIINQKLPHLMSKDFPYYIGLEQTKNYNQSLTQLRDYLKDNEKILSLINEVQQENQTIDFQNIFPCISHQESACLPALLHQRAIMEQIIVANKIILNRYKTILKSSQYLDDINRYNEDIDFDTTTWNQHQVFLTRLMFSELIFMLEDKDYKSALSQLELLLQQRQIWMNEDNNHTLPSSIVNIAMRSITDELLNELLTTGYLNPLLNEAIVEQIFAPYSRIDRGTIVIDPIIQQITPSELMYNLRPYLDLDHSTKQPNSLILSEQDEFIAMNYLEFLGYYIPPLMDERLEKLKVTSQFAYPESQITLEEDYPFSSYEEAQKQMMKEWNTLTKWHKDYFVNKGISLDDIFAYFNQHYPTAPYMNELYRYSLLYKKTLLSDDYQRAVPELVKTCQQNSIYITKDCDSYQQSLDYIHRYEEQVIYHHLVYLKYQIMKNKIKDRDISAFLVSQSEYTKHPSRNESIEWNPEKRTLSIPLAKELKYLPINIRTRVSKDKEITHWEVSIPKQ